MALITVEKREVINPRFGNDGKALRLRPFDAFRLMQDKGGLPSNLLLDECLNCEEGAYKKLPGDYWPALSGTIFAHPARWETFAEGKDITDTVTGWTIPWSGLVSRVAPGTFIGAQGAGLAITGRIERENGRDGKTMVVVHPFSIIPKTGLVETDGEKGKLEPETGLVLKGNPETDADARVLWRKQGMGLMPLVRDVDGCGDRRNVNAYDRRDDGYGVAGFETGLSVKGKGEHLAQAKKALDPLAGLNLSVDIIPLLASSDAILEMVVKGTREALGKAEELLRPLAQ